GRAERVHRDSCWVLAVRGWGRKAGQLRCLGAVAEAGHQRDRVCASDAARGAAAEIRRAVHLTRFRRVPSTAWLPAAAAPEVLEPHRQSTLDAVPHPRRAGLQPNTALPVLVVRAGC